MKEILQNIQNRLSTITEIRYIDEDWGQIDYYSPNMPVQYPCALIDLASGQFTNISKDFSKQPNNRQIGDFSVKITLVNLRLSNTSLKSPQIQKDNTWGLFDLVEKIHQTLHGWRPKENCSKLLRNSFTRVMRDDGLQEYNIIYSFEVHNI